MVAFLTQAPTGIPGEVTRPDKSQVEPAMLVAVGGTTFPSAYGIAMKNTTGGIQQFNGGAETKASFAGVLVREVPTIAGDLTSDTQMTPQTPNSQQPQGLLVAGYINVLCAAGTPARGGVVYVQIVSHSGVLPGQFRADGTDSGNAIALDQTQATWASDGMDANTNAEIRVQTVL